MVGGLGVAAGDGFGDRGLAPAGSLSAPGVAEAPWDWSAEELAADLFSKAVYAVVTGLAYDTLRCGPAGH